MAATKTITLRLEDPEWAALYSRAAVEGIAPATIARRILAAGLNGHEAPADVIPLRRATEVMAEAEYLGLPLYTTPGDLGVGVPWQSDDDPAWPESRRRAYLARDEQFEAG